MSLPFPDMVPDWKWGTSEGSREFDRRLDRTMSFSEIVVWLEEAENLTLTLALRASREAAARDHPGDAAPDQR